MAVHDDTWPQSHLIVLTGPIGSGKTTLCEALRPPIPIVSEPARIVLGDQRAFGGEGVPEKDPRLFLELMLARAVRDHRANGTSDRTVLFDRAIPDMIAYARLFGINEASAKRAADQFRYRQDVFVTADWPEIYATDDERQMSYAEARRFGETVRGVYLELGYRLIEVPAGGIEERRGFILARL